MWEPKQGVRCILRTATPPSQIVRPSLSLLVLHVAGPFMQFSGSMREREWKVMELNVKRVHSVFCFTLLFECVLQGNMVYRRLAQWVNCRRGLGCLTGLGAGL